MKDEIFGPILPVLSFTDLNEAIKIVDRNLYLAISIQKTEKQLINY